MSTKVLSAASWRLLRAWHLPCVSLEAYRRLLLRERYFRYLSFSAGKDSVMNQGTHAWIAVRAVGLLAKDPDTMEFGRMLSGHVCEAAVGAWLPDLANARVGSSRIDNHIFKMKPYRDPERERFTTDKKQLLKNLGKSRAMTSFLGNDVTLDDTWWTSSYKAAPRWAVAVEGREETRLSGARLPLVFACVAV